MSDPIKPDQIMGIKVRLRSKTPADAREDFIWHKDPKLASLDAATPLRCSFDEYYEDYVAELQYSISERNSFSVETLDGEHIGNCVYYNIDNFRRHAELGIMIGNRAYWNNGYGTDTVITLVNHIFQETKLNRIYLKTLVDNYRAQTCFGKCNFEPCGYLDRDGYNFLLMDIHRHDWEKQQTISTSEQQPVV